jgi:uncharacterized protein (TIRG00374 family)
MADRAVRTRYWWSTLKSAVALLLVALLCWTVDWRDSLSLLRDVSRPWTLTAVLLVVVSVVVSAWKWQLLLLARGIRVGLPRLVRLYWVGIFFNNLMPSTFGGDVARLALARHIAGVGPIAASMLVERATGFLVLVAIALATLTVQPGLADVRHMGFPVAGVLTAGGVMLQFVLWRGRIFARTATSFAFWHRWPTAGVLRRLRPLLEAVRGYGGDHRALLVTCGVSVLFYAGLILSHYAVIRGVHGHLTLAQVALAAPLVIFIAALPVTINGIGITEGAFVLLYGQFGLTPEVALAAALLRRIVILAASLIGAACWLAERRPARDAASDHQARTRPLPSALPIA